MKTGFIDLNKTQSKEQCFFKKSNVESKTNDHLKKIFHLRQILQSQRQKSETKQKEFPSQAQKTIEELREMLQNRKLGCKTKNERLRLSPLSEQKFTNNSRPSGTTKSIDIKIINKQQFYQQEELANRSVMQLTQDENQSQNRKSAKNLDVQQGINFEGKSYFSQQESSYGAHNQREQNKCFQQQVSFQNEIPISASASSGKKEKISNFNLGVSNQSFLKIKQISSQKQDCSTQTDESNLQIVKLKEPKIKLKNTNIKKRIEEKSSSEEEIQQSTQPTQVIRIVVRKKTDYKKKFDITLDDITPWE
ncbi:UNKNOWN [Stylonychia lemnae]|uniref:Uncharacterized protein n=1 Tax=Stylonychia lemnae TaxID=5949 RepID=A0A078ALK1_STYLE|nr:UNKNOWN [Stylonychia lemnae]|eukprot:CDW83235.1 UNKNOWN [Stylonychia lemnae]